uniref:ArsR/SmtB family transcription factor n=1 Tax=Paractinoplanes polyasparticus TaxID=2856853 RepID=UPI001C8625ED|nr:winged helix-turn-helix domain-containing protein [Actinoplanes polyasparticus]
MTSSERTGDELVQVLSTLSNPHRIRIVAALLDGREYVSRLARRLQISRALLQVHLRKLEAAGLVEATLELSPDGKAMKYYTIRQFAIELTPQALAAAAATLTYEEARLRDDAQGQG